jgi:hypothetical protein
MLSASFMQQWRIVHWDQPSGTPLLLSPPLPLLSPAAVPGGGVGAQGHSAAAAAGVGIWHTRSAAPQFQWRAFGSRGGSTYRCAAAGTWSHRHAACVSDGRPA